MIFERSILTVIIVFTGLHMTDSSSLRGAWTRSPAASLQETTIPVAKHAHETNTRIPAVPLTRPLAQTRVQLDKVGATEVQAFAHVIGSQKGAATLSGPKPAFGLPLPSPAKEGLARVVGRDDSWLKYSFGKGWYTPPNPLTWGTKNFDPWMPLSTSVPPWDHGYWNNFLNRTGAAHPWYTTNQTGGLTVPKSKSGSPIDWANRTFAKYETKDWSWTDPTAAVSSDAQGTANTLAYSVSDWTVNAARSSEKLPYYEVALPPAPPSTMQDSAASVPVPALTAEWTAPPVATAEYTAPPVATAEYTAPPVATVEYTAPPVAAVEYTLPPVASAEYTAPPSAMVAYTAPPDPTNKDWSKGDWNQYSQQDWTAVPLPASVYKPAQPTGNFEPSEQGWYARANPIKNYVKNQDGARWTQYRDRDWRIGDSSARPGNNGNFKKYETFGKWEWAGGKGKNCCSGSSGVAWEQPYGKGIYKDPQGGRAGKGR